jgi:hypothetical protein
MQAFLAIRFAPNTGDQPMELIVVTDNRDVADVLATVDPSAKTKPIKSLGTLHADLSGASAIAFTVKSITAVATLAKSAWKAIEPYLMSKPKGKFCGIFMIACFRLRSSKRFGANSCLT